MKSNLLLALFTLLPIYGLTADVSYELPEVVVTAERKAIDRKQEPQAVTVVTQKDIEQKGASNVSEAVADVLGLDISRGSQNSTSAMGGHQLMIRGMNTNETLVLVDGHRLADEDTGQTQNVYLLSRLDLSKVERIEILRGPAGAMYGSDAMGGVIQIITKKPGHQEMDYGWHIGSREEETHVRYDPGAMGRWRFSFDGRLTKVRPIFFRNTSFIPSRWMQYDGYDVPAYGNQQHFGLDLMYDFQNTNQNALRFTSDYFHEKTTLDMADATMSLSQVTAGTGMPEGGASRMPPIVVQKDAVNLAERTEMSHSLSYTGKTARHDYEGRVYYSTLKKHSENINHRPDANEIDLSTFSPAYDAVIPDMKNKLDDMLDQMMPRYSYDRASYHLWGLEGKDTMTFSRHTVTYGGEFRQYTYKGTRLVSQQENPGKEGKHGREEEAFYVSDWWDVSPKVHLSPSLRLAKGSTYSLMGTPKIGLTYEWDPKTRLKANYGKGFRAPTISELYLHMDTGHPIEIFGNPELLPEKSTSYDLGLEWERGKTSYHLSYFHNDVKNLIDTQYEGDHYSYVNRKKAAIQGLEMEFSHPWHENWTLDASYTYVDGKDKSSSTRLDNRSRHTLVGSISYDDHHSYGYTGKLWDSFHGDYHFDGKDYTYHAVNLSIQKHWGPSLLLTAGLYNMGNKKIDALYINGREWYLGMEYKM